MNRLILTAGTLALLMLAQTQSAQASTLVATISGGYDLDLYDTPELVFNNTSTFAFTNAQVVLTGYQGINNGATASASIGTIGAGSTYKMLWNGATGGGTGLFAYDYDDSRGGTAPCPPNPVNTGLCGNPGNFYVTFTAIWNGQNIYSQFSPSVNATGGFVGWEGLTPGGVSESPAYDVHNGSLTGTLANIYVGNPNGGFNPVSEPSIMALFGLGFFGMGAINRKLRLKSS
jgi:hypothetical protein